MVRVVQMDATFDVMRIFFPEGPHAQPRLLDGGEICKRFVIVMLLDMAQQCGIAQEVAMALLTGNGGQVVAVSDDWYHIISLVYGINCRRACYGAAPE